MRAPTLVIVRRSFMGCGCGGKPLAPSKPGAAQAPALSGPANPNFTWPPRGNGPKPKAA